MNSYVKEVKIKPMFDLSEANKQMESLKKEFGKAKNDLQESFKDIEKVNVDINVNTKQLLHDINKDINDKVYLNVKGSFNDIFKGLEQSLFSKDNDKNNIDNQIDELNKYITYLNNSGKQVEEASNALKTQVSQIEGYDVYQAKQKLRKNESEIYNLKLEDDDPQIQKRIEELKEINKDLKKKIFEYKGVDNSKQIESVLNEIKQLDTSFEEINDNKEQSILKMNYLQNSKKTKSNTPDWKKIGENIGNLINQTLSKLINSLVDGFKNLVSDSIEEFKNLASYSFDTSLKINNTAREQALTYGLSESENYALSRTRERMNITSEEDMLTMTPRQQEEFARLVGKYSGEYEKLSNQQLLAKYEEFTSDFEDFKDDLTFEVIEFFANNKDTIINLLDFTMKCLEGILDAINFISKFFGANNGTNNTTSDILKSYSISNNNSSTNVKISNNFNDVSTKDLSTYTRAGEMVNEQLINALK